MNRGFSEIQQGERLAVMMASHPRLGDASPLGQASMHVDVLALIALVCSAGSSEVCFLVYSNRHVSSTSFGWNPVV